MGAEAPLHAAFPDNTIISAVVWTGGRAVPADQGAGAEQFNREGLTIGVDYRAPQDAAIKKEERAKLDTLVEWLSAGKGDCTVTEEIQTERWIKVIWWVPPFFEDVWGWGRARGRGATTAVPSGQTSLILSSACRNCCWNSITTVTRVKTNRFFESSPQALPLCYTVMEEVVAVARAKGMTVPDDTVPKLIKQCTDVTTGLPSSMMADNFAGRPMEVEVILGTPVREAERLGVPVPTLLTWVSPFPCGNAVACTR